MRRDQLPEGDVLDTIYIGGGTPSQLSPEQLADVFSCIFDIYPVLPDAEVTLEANPDDLTASYVDAISRLPVNRISLGVQSFHDDELRSINRRHSAKAVCDVYEQLKKNGFENISLDLIYGLPSHNMERWRETLLKTLTLRPTHISAYHLIYEENTPLWRELNVGRIKPVDEELSLALFEELMDVTEAAGYEHYEISNFALPAYRSRHNSAYWQGEAYLGFGPSAHGYDGGFVRRANVPNLLTYIEQIRIGVFAETVEELSIRDRFNEQLLAGLRTKDGVTCAQLSCISEEMFRQTLSVIDRYVKRGLLLETSDGFRLSRQGIFISDTIISDLFVNA